MAYLSVGQNERALQHARQAAELGWLLGMFNCTIKLAVGEKTAHFCAMLSNWACCACGRHAVFRRAASGSLRRQETIVMVPGCNG